MEHEEKKSKNISESLRKKSEEHKQKLLPLWIKSCMRHQTHPKAVSCVYPRRHHFLIALAKCLESEILNHVSPWEVSAHVKVTHEVADCALDYEKLQVLVTSRIACVDASTEQDNGSWGVPSLV